MEVTRTNFQEVLEELDSVLRGATFLSIDGEFTGLNSGPDAKPFDTPAQYYNKLRSGSMDFLMIQFGLSVFTHNPKNNKYSQRSYNFYVFPRPLNRNAPDCRFMCQSSSISFLAGQGFDFNKLFNCGIPYLTMMEEEKLSKKFEERQKIREDGLELIPISDEDKPQIDEICTRIDEFLSSDAEEMSIDRCNAFVRRLIHQEARMRWPQKVRLEAKTEGGNQTLVVYKMGTKEEEKRKEAERRDKEKQEIKDAVGLTALLRKVADSGKLIVGHNMLLDLCHMIHQFFGPLPESYRELKSLIHGLFPRLLDTKVICQSAQFKDKVPSSILDAVLDTVSKNPFSIPEIEPVEGRSYSLTCGKHHEAGYDAFITGVCFIALINNLGLSQQPQVSTVLPDSPLLNPFLNKLLITRLKDFAFINLEANDPKPSRDHVFHITFPKEWKLSDLSQLFSPFGGVYVSWLSDVTAYVGLNRRDQSSNLLKNLSKDKRMQKCRIQTYAEHQISLDENSATVASDRKRKSPAENVKSGKDRTKEQEDVSANGVDNSQEEDGWEMASGNEVKIVSSRNDHVNCENSPSPSPLSMRYKSKSRVDPAPKRRTPKFFRGEKSDNRRFDKFAGARDEVDSAVDEHVLSTIDTTRSSILDESLNNIKFDDLEIESEIEEPKTSSSRSGRNFKNSPNHGRVKYSFKTCDDSPTSSHEVTRGPKRKSKLSNSSPNTEKSTISSVDCNVLKKRLVYFNAAENEQVSLKKPNVKLLQSTKRKSETISNTSLLFRIAQVIGIALFFFYIIMFSDKI